jgi:hypothetical protein
MKENVSCYYVYLGEHGELFLILAIDNFHYIEIEIFTETQSCF